MIAKQAVFKALVACFFLLIIITTIKSLNKEGAEQSIDLKKEYQEEIKPLLGNSTKEAEALAEYAKIQLVQPRSTNNIYELGLRLRVLRRLIELGQEEGEVYEHLTKQIFPWAKRLRLSEYIGDPASKGIVICTGDEYFKFTVHSIRVIRQVHNCSLPIEVFYIGEKDLSLKHRKFLETELVGVKVKDITEYFDQSILKLKGWDAKPFAMIASSFSQVLMLDADTVLVQSPEAFFNDIGYREEGALFFHDRTLFPTDQFKREWLQSLFPKPYSSLLRSRRFFNSKTSYEQEAGAVAVDKNIRLMGLLATCALNNQEEREKVIHQETHGDKETFWLGFELVGLSYSFNPSMSGAVGSIEVDQDKKQKQVICGKLAHFDRAGRLWWFNDSISMGKKDKEMSMEVSNNLNHFVIEEGEAKWNGFLCLGGKKIEKLAKEELDRIEKIKHVFIPDPIKVKLKDKINSPKQNHP
jgi:hypothetical protein